MHNHQYVFRLKNGFELKTSAQEIKDLSIAWLFVSAAFAVVRTYDLGIGGDIFSAQFLTLMLISGITVGVGFLLHELAHKIIAQRYHCWAEFRADMTMLVLALIMSFFGFVFIAPGAVFIFGRITTRQNGIISLGGPATNIIIAFILFPFTFMNIQHTILSEIIHFGFYVNAWLALFNMIPLWNFDGRKIYAWNKTAYFVTLAIAAFLVFFYFMQVF